MNPHYKAIIQIGKIADPGFVPYGKELIHVEVINPFNNMSIAGMVPFDQPDMLGEIVKQCISTLEKDQEAICGPLAQTTARGASDE